MASGDELSKEKRDVASTSTALECPVCKSLFSEPVMLLPCAHLFCKTCLEASLATAALCPLDRLPVHPQRDVKPAPRVIRDLVDEHPVHCEACTWRGRSDALSDHLCSVGLVSVFFLEIRSMFNSNVYGLQSGSSQAESSKSRKEDAEVALCPQSLRGCPARLRPSELDQHAATCPFVALGAYFDIQDARSALLHAQLAELSSQVSHLDQRLTQQSQEMQSSLSTVEANLEAAQVRSQLAVLDESMQIAHEFSGLRAGLEGVRRQLFGLLVERESRVGQPRMPFMPPQPMLSPSLATTTTTTRTDTGTKL